MFTSKIDVHIGKYLALSSCMLCFFLFNCDWSCSIYSPENENEKIRISDITKFFGKEMFEII